MISEVKKAAYTFAETDISEIARYSGARETDENLISLISSCIKEAEDENAVGYEVCYTETSIETDGKTVKTPAAEFKSERLSKLLGNSSSAIIFAATLGIGIDRLIKKYSETNPSRALIFQALGAERIETFTDLFLSEYSKKSGVSLTDRFSPGYADLSLSAQRDIFALLNPQKLIGLTLNDSLIMSPSKSITAIAGVGGKSVKAKCMDCKKDCQYRR